MDLADVERTMLADWAVRGADAPAWPDPHELGPPRDDEYERVTDWSKYRIVGLRVHSWVQAMVGLGLAATEPAPPGARPGITQSSFWLRPSNRTATAVRIYLTLKDGVVDSGVAVGDTWIPRCGCDACDSGSELLLDEVDALFVAVLNGAAAGDRRSWFG